MGLELGFRVGFRVRVRVGVRVEVMSLSESSRREDSDVSYFVIV